MFPDSEISFNLKLGKTKCAYLMNYGIAPHFKSNLLKSINNSSFYSLSFDESLNNVLQICQMDINIRYLNKAKNVLETRYLDSKFVSRPNADNLFQQLEYILKELFKIKFCRLSMDKPSVNWNVLDKFDNYLNEKDIPLTIQIGSCNQHILHATLKTAMNQSACSFDKILKALYQSPHDSHARSDIYATEGGGSVFPLRFVK